jgi:methyltransferase (TIGR00027 family)
MNLPNLTGMLNVGELRYIQSLCEATEYRNPDVLVGAFLSMQRRLACLVRGRFFKSWLRAKPFYHYLLARTKYYDEVFLDAVRDSVGCVVNIGCGSDTRAYRFQHLLRQKGVSVLECDQPQAIEAKQKIARRHWPTDHIQYVALDLHDGDWNDLMRRLEGRRPVLVMMEGVSPYVSQRPFEAFLRALAARLDPRSVVAYDFKIVDTVEDFGLTVKVQQPFRLPAERKRVAAYHAALGFELRHMELSSELSKRLLPQAPLLFDRDCLLRLNPLRAS